MELSYDSFIHSFIYLFNFLLDKYIPTFSKSPSCRERLKKLIDQKNFCFFNLVRQISPLPDKPR